MHEQSTPIPDGLGGCEGNLARSCRACTSQTPIWWWPCCVACIYGHSLRLVLSSRKPPITRASQVWIDCSRWFPALVCTRWKILWARWCMTKSNYHQGSLPSLLMKKAITKPVSLQQVATILEQHLSLPHACMCVIFRTHLITAQPPYCADVTTAQNSKIKLDWKTGAAATVLLTCLSCWCCHLF